MALITEHSELLTAIEDKDNAPIFVQFIDKGILMLVHISAKVNASVIKVSGHTHSEGFKRRQGSASH